MHRINDTSQRPQIELQRWGLPIRPKWRGPALLMLGSVMLALQIHAWLDVRMLSPGLLGGGIAFVVIGFMAYLHYRKEGKSGASLTSVESLPTADEYDRGLEDVAVSDE